MKRTLKTALVKNLDYMCFQVYKLSPGYTESVKDYERTVKTSKYYENQARNNLDSRRSLEGELNRFINAYYKTKHKYRTLVIILSILLIFSFIINLILLSK